MHFVESGIPKDDRYNYICLDGVICSTDHYHYLAWKKLSDELHISFDEKDNEKLRGVSRMESLDIF